MKANTLTLTECHKMAYQEAGGCKKAPPKHEMRYFIKQKYFDMLKTELRNNHNLV